MMKQMVVWHARGSMLGGKIKQFLKGEAGEFNDGGSTNWGRNIAIGFAIAFIVFGLVQALLPEVIDSWKGKVMEFFN